MCARHRPGSYSTISYHWREPAAHAGAQTGPRQFVAKPRSLRTKTARTSPYALCLRASAPPVNVLYPQACLVICDSPTNYVFSCPCNPTSHTTPSERVTVYRQPLPSLLIVSTKKRAQLADPQKPAHFPRPHPLELSPPIPKPTPPRLSHEPIPNPLGHPPSYPRTFCALSTPTYPRNFHARIPSLTPELSKHFQYPYPSTFHAHTKALSTPTSSNFPRPHTS